MILAALLASVNVPFSVYLLGGLSPFLLASLTYLGAALGVGILDGFLRLSKKDKEPPLRGKDFLILGIINGMDLAGNTMLFLGISSLSGETSSLLQSLEVVTTALLAFFIFKERLSKRLLSGILLLLLSASLLFFNPQKAFSFEPAGFWILGAMLCWGVDNNLTKKISDKDPLEFVFLKTLIPGLILFLFSSLFQGLPSRLDLTLYGLLDGFLAYGLSIVFMFLALRHLSASEGSAIYSSSPFLGALWVLVLKRELPSWNVFLAFLLLSLGEVLIGGESYWKKQKEENGLFLVSR